MVRGLVSCCRTPIENAIGAWSLFPNPSLANVPAEICNLSKTVRTTARYARSILLQVVLSAFARVGSGWKSSVTPSSAFAIVALAKEKLGEPPLHNCTPSYLV